MQDPNKLARLKESYDSLMDAMDIVGFTTEEQDSMFQILSGILALGNIEFELDGEVCKVTNSESLNLAAQILGLRADELQDVLTRNVIFTAGQEIVRNYTMEQATGMKKFQVF